MATGPAAFRVHGRIVGPDPVIRMPSGVHLMDLQGVLGFVDEFRLRRHPAEPRSCPGLHGGDRDIGLTGLVTSWSPGGAVDCAPGGHDVCCRSNRRLELHGATQRLQGPPDGLPVRRVFTVDNAHQVGDDGVRHGGGHPMPGAVTPGRDHHTPGYDPI